MQRHALLAILTGLEKPASGTQKITLTSEKLLEMLLQTANVRVLNDSCFLSQTYGMALAWQIFPSHQIRT